MNPITMKLVVDDLILQALREDITFEDVSTASVCPTARPATVELIAKADGIIAGLDVFARTFELLDSQSSVLFDVADGDEVHAGDHVGQARGDARVLLSGERVALNYLQRMSARISSVLGFIVCPPAMTLSTPRSLKISFKPSPMETLIKPYSFCG